MLPKISIVTPSYNQGQFLEQTIQSVLDQNYPNLEYIVIDGGSTDNSVDIIKKYAPALKYWISEKDNGQSAAINKGLALCTGEIFNWLNSDDYLEENALFKISEAFSNKNIQMVAGGLRKFSNAGSEVIHNNGLTAEGLMCWTQGVEFAQPSAWLRKNNIEACGGIDEKFHYSFDWDLYIRYLYLFPTVTFLPDVLAHFRLHDFSKTQSSSARFIIEEREIIKKVHQLPQFENLHAVCKLKIQKTEWTAILSAISKSNNPLHKKISAAIQKMKMYKEVSFSRQTLGALKAFITGKIIV